MPLPTETELRQPDHQNGSCMLADEVPWNDEAGDSRKHPCDPRQYHETMPLVQC